MTDSLFLTEDSHDKKQFEECILRTMEYILNSVQDENAYTGPAPDKLSKIIGSHKILPEEGLGFEPMMQNVKKAILPNFLRTSSTKYMAHLHSPALKETIASELIIASFNQSMDSWDQSPVATETEVAVVKELDSLYGYSTDSEHPADGCFTSGGSQSNLTAILLARDWFCKTKFNYDVKKFGLPPEYRKFRLYTSEISHFSMEKSCHLLGLGYESVVKVPVDKNQRMDVEALKSLVARDIQNGNIPFCIVATIGTTDFGSIDNVEELRKVAESCGAWLHADAAYGSALILCNKYKSRIGNLSLCDSITVDFHKMFLLPISCSAVLVKDGRNFEPLELHADYLNREEDEEDGYTNLVGKSIQTTRRFDALKVWMAFLCRGKNGFENIIAHCIENASYVYEKLVEKKDFVPAIKPELSSVVFRVIKYEDENKNDELNKKIRRALLLTKGTVIGQTVYNNRVHLKFTLLNPRVTHESLDSLLQTIEDLAH